MELRCIMCGRKETLTEDNVDYRKYEENPKAIYICTICNAKTYNEAKEGQKPVKPI